MKGKVLISEPFLLDPTFKRSVILITEHEDAGSVGYVLNQRTDLAVNMLIDRLSMVNNSAYQGGPVELDSLHYLHAYPEVSGCVKVMDGVYWSGDFDEVCEGLLTGKMTQKNFCFLVGYSGWSAGQLKDELAQKSWIVGDLDASYIFDQNIPDDELWKIALRNQGGTDALLANAPDDPLLN